MRLRLPDGARLSVPASQIGPFKLLGILGEGGYGIVYLAAQEQPIRRRVALKVIKPGMDSRQVIARFEAERQALALLDHPNIAHVYDAGTTPEGRPYFAMEYIEGLPITEYCDRERLSIRERLQLFLQVCSAVQHAHQKGIIHRDLKPSNILVTAKDGEARIRIIDFGIAKALAQSLTEKTLYTEQGQFIGTPDYMSPEQAEMDAHGMDTRSDVYSLGVVLYELLTGVLPFDPDALRAGGVDTSADGDPGAGAAHAQHASDGLGEELDEDRRTPADRPPDAGQITCAAELEWIPLKAMRKEIARRYQSAAELAVDIDNYLQDKPLLAGPESVTYRARKLLRRHRTSVAAAAVALTALVAGLIVSTLMYLTAERARQDAVQAETAEQEQRKLADSARVEAEKRLADLYENQGNDYLASEEFDKALVFLSEAYKIDGTRLSVRLSLLEGLRKHGDPNLRQISAPVPWQGVETDQNLFFCVSPSRTLAAFADNTAHLIYVQRTDTGAQVRRLPASDVLNLAFTPDDRHIVAKIRKDQGHHVIKAFDIAGGVEVASLGRRTVDIDSVHRLTGEHPPDKGQLEATYNGILISPTANWFAFVDVQGTGADLKARVRLWDFAANTLRTAEEEFVGQFIIGIGYRIPSAYGHTDGLLIVDRERVVHSFAVPDLTFEWKYPFGITSAVLSADGLRFLTFAEPSMVTLFDRSGNRSIRQFPGTDGYGFSPDSRYAVTERAGAAGDDPDASRVRIDVWDARDGRYVTGLTSTGVENLHFTSDSKHMVTEHKDRGIRVWSLRGFVSTFEIPAGENRVVTDLSADGRWLLTRRRDDAGPIRLYDLESGRSFAPHECRTARRNLNDGWAGVTAGRVFSSPFVSPQQLPLFNRDGSRIITASGLWAFLEHTPEFRMIPGLWRRAFPCGWSRATSDLRPPATCYRRRPTMSDSGRVRTCPRRLACSSKSRSSSGPPANSTRPWSWRWACCR